MSLSVEQLNILLITKFPGFHGFSVRDPIYWYFDVSLICKTRLYQDSGLYNVRYPYKCHHTQLTKLILPGNGS